MPSPLFPFTASALAIGLALTALPQALAQVPCPEPERLEFHVAHKIQRSETAFTQGLEFVDGKLLEGTGSLDGSTRLNIVDPASGQVQRLVEVGPSVFGEGITVLNGELFQLTWKDRVVFVRNLRGNVLRQMRNEREGWGLTNDGENLIFSDGSGSLFVADPKTFATTREIAVRSRPGTSLTGLNELELVHGKILANVFMSWMIVRIDPGTGCIEAVSDLRNLTQQMDPRERAGLASDGNNVLNGIAYDAKTDTYFLTGKRWRSIFAGRFQALPR